VTGPGVGVPVGVGVRVGVIVGVFVIVGVGQPPVGQGVGVSVLVGVFVIVGVSVIVGDGGSTTVTAPAPTAGAGRTAPFARESWTSCSVSGLTPLPSPCSVIVARMPDPVGPAGRLPSVLHTKVKSPGGMPGWKQVTERPVLPRNGPS
jgi:hypothetical protein